NQGGLGVQAGVVYTLSFWARADRAATISVQLEQAHDPWQGLGLDRPVGVDTSWQHFQYSFVLNEDEANARLNFRDLADETATYWFAGLALARGGSIGLLPGEDLGAASIRIVLRSEADLRNAQGRQDWCEFLWKTEESYWTQMRRHLRETVGTDALLIGTVVGTSTPNLMNLFDVIDSHAYWQHPSFESDWGSPWWIRNDSMVVDPQGGTIPGLALKRIYGKPFSVSEYNHPFPNSFGSEGFLFLAAYGALQDWDAIYGYTYSDGNLDWSGDFQTGYFDLHRNPGKMISLFHAACLFRRGDLSAARRLVVGRLTSQEEIALLPGASAWRLLDGRDAGIPPPAALLHRTALEVDGTVAAPDPLDPNSVEIPDDRRFESDTAEITWDSPLRVLRIDSPGSKGLIGYVVGQSFTLGDFEIAPINSLQGWAAIFLSRLTSDGPTRRYVVSTHGLVQNHGQQWRDYPSGLPVGLPPPAGADLTLGSWGSAPVEVEAITCDIRLPFPPEKLSVYALDGTGARRTPVPLVSDGEGTRFRLSPEFETLWYEIVLADLASRSAVAGFETRPGDFVGLSLTNPVDQDAAVRLALYPAEASDGPELLLDTVLPANSQSAKLLPEWFGTASIPSRGWIEVASDQTAVSAMAQCGDSRLDRLDGLPAVAGSASPVLLTRVCDGPRHFRGQAVSTWVSVANLAPVPTRVELILKVPAEPGGPVSRLVEVGRTTVALDGERSIVKTAGELFDAQIENGCIEVHPLDASAVAASEVVELLERDTIFALNGAAPIPASRLYSPQVAALPGHLFSSIRLINTAASSRPVTLRAFGDSGQSLAPPVTIDLPADGLFEQDAGLLFQTQFGIEASLIGSLVVEVGGDGGVMGDIVFGLADLGYAAASPLQSAGYRHASLGQVANLPGLFFTGLALFNPGDDAVVVRIEVRSSEGTLRGFLDCPLPARGRISDLIANLLPATERQVGGYILLSSDRDFLAQELWGTASLSLLSAIPAQAFE
ncbi:MAG: carbohydrate binding domain-containing protein, partial [Acidobacteriota bacterium]